MVMDNLTREGRIAFVFLKELISNIERAYDNHDKASYLSIIHGECVTLVSWLSHEVAMKNFKKDSIPIMDKIKR